MSCWKAQAGRAAGESLAALVEHARRMRSLMGFVPRRYDPTIIEGLALTGALDPDLDGAERDAAVAKAAAWMDGQDVEANWTRPRSRRRWLSF